MLGKPLPAAQKVSFKIFVLFFQCTQTAITSEIIVWTLLLQMI